MPPQHTKTCLWAWSITHTPNIKFHFINVICQTNTADDTNYVQTNTKEALYNLFVTFYKMKGENLLDW